MIDQTRFSPGARALAALEMAMHPEVMPERHDFINADIHDRAAPWPSSVAALDAMTLGGFYGVSVIAAEGKLGKTTLSLAAAIEAAASLRWRVVYFNAELDEADMDERVGRYIDVHPHCSDADQLFEVYHVGRGVDPATLAATVHEHPTEDPVLIVLDSINTIANLSRMPYLEALKQFSLWALMARRISSGMCSFQIVAETNRAGGIKGEQLQYWADLILRIRGTKTAGWVDLDITHSRRTESGSLGRYIRHVPTASFLKDHEIALRGIDGGKA